MTERITRGDIEAGLRRLGLGAGDVVLLHSSLSSLGSVEGGAETVVSAFLAGRAQEVLDQRVRALMYVGTLGWQERSARLYAAAEAARKLGGK